VEFLFIWLVCAIVTGIIASSKGRTGFGWFLIGCIIGIFGVILIACLPSRKPLPVQQVVMVPPAAAAVQPVEAKTKTCPDCAEEVMAGAKICKHCRHVFVADAPSQPVWDGVLRR
jgi:Na+/melibiose symporter-like transporter